MSIYTVTKTDALPETGSGIDPSLLQDFCLLAEGSIVATPAGRPITHSNRKLLEAIAKEGNGAGGLVLDEITLYRMYCLMVDCVEPERETKTTSEPLLLGDLLFRLCAGPEVVDQLAMLEPAVEYLKHHGLSHFSFSQSATPAAIKRQIRSDGMTADWQRTVAFFDARMSSFAAAQHAVVTNCVSMEVPFTLGVLLADSACSVEEYADAFLALHCQIPGVFGDVSKREVSTVRRQLIADAKKMLQFRDLADAS